MNASLDESGTPIVSNNGNIYYSRQNAASYIGMTDSGFRRKIQFLEDNYDIIIPLEILPISRKKRFIDKRILDVFRKSVRVGHEEEWREELKKVVNEVNEGR